jgi:hypothetical protein
MDVQRITGPDTVSHRRLCWNDRGDIFRSLFYAGVFLCNHEDFCRGAKDEAKRRRASNTERKCRFQVSPSLRDRGAQDASAAFGLRPRSSGSGIAIGCTGRVRTDSFCDRECREGFSKGNTDGHRGALTNVTADLQPKGATEQSLQPST